MCQNCCDTAEYECDLCENIVRVVDGALVSNAADVTFCLDCRDDPFAEGFVSGDLYEPRYRGGGLKAPKVLL